MMLPFPDREENDYSSRMYDTQEAPERALLFTTFQYGDDKNAVRLSKEELQSLVLSLGIQVLDHLDIQLRQINPSTLIGKGKVEEIGALVEADEATLVISNQPIRPQVQRNLEKTWGVPVIDREEVILRIFSERARTKAARLQVELARLTYTRPRLARAVTGLSQQRGGGFQNRGQGETQLEIDQRRIGERIASLKKELDGVVKERQLQKSRRMSSPVPRLALVGYTNSGKSTLLNHFSEGAARAEDKLFATLDPTTRLVKLKGGESFLLTDTVGFVSNLPTELVEAFKSTLEEAVEADLLVLVADASHPAMLSCYQTTLDVLSDLGVKDKSRLLFINKMDKEYDDFSVARLKSLEAHVVTGSLKTGEGLDKLEDMIGALLHTLSPTFDLVVPETRYDLVARLKREAQILHIDYTGSGVCLTIRTRNPALAQSLIPFLVRKE